MKKKFEIDVDERFLGTDNTIHVRNFQLVIFQGKILTMEEYMRALITKAMERPVDKKMKKVTDKIKKAETTLKKAQKENEKLTAYDKKVRDPEIEKCHQKKKKKK